MSLDGQAKRTYARHPVIRLVDRIKIGQSQRTRYERQRADQDRQDHRLDLIPRLCRRPTTRQYILIRRDVGGGRFRKHGGPLQVIPLA